MNERNFNDDHILELINRGIDGELNQSQRDELDQLLGDSARLRRLNEQLKAVTGLLDALPRREPPEYLRNAITSQVRLRVPVRDNSGKQGFFSTWLPANWLRTGFALAAGAVLTVGIYQIGSETTSPEDVSNMTGTLVQKPLPDHGVLLDSIRIDTAALNGVVELRQKDEVFILDIRFESEGPAEVGVDIAGWELEFEGLELATNPRKQNLAEAVSIEHGSVRIASSGEQHYYALLLRRTSGEDWRGSAPLGLEFFANDKLIHQAEIGGSQQTMD